MSPPINSQTKQTVYNVYKYFKARKQDLTSAEHHNDINLHKTVAEATGFSDKSVQRIVKLGKSMEGVGGEVKFTSPEKQKQTRKKRIEMDKATEDIIRRKVTEYYTIRKEVPTIKKIKKVLEDDGVLKCGHEYMRQLLHKLGFKFKTKTFSIDSVEKTKKCEDHVMNKSRNAMRDCSTIEDDFEISDFLIVDIQETDDDSISNHSSSDSDM